MKKRLFSLFLVLILVLDMFPAAVFAVGDGQDEVFSTDGEEVVGELVNEVVDGVIQVTDQETLANMNERNYQLANDIELVDWESKNFSGKLDGNGYKITLNGQPLFNKLEGTVVNLLLDGQVTGSGNALGALANISSGIIRNSYTDVTVNYNGFFNVGGIIGKIEDGYISNCLATGIINDSMGMADGGGIAGADPWSGNNAIIDNCYWTSNYSNAAPNTVATNSEKIDIEQSGSVQRATILNANLKEGDLPWGVTDGVLVPGGKGKPVEVVVNKDNLNTEITKAKALNESSYTADTWVNFKEALLKAEETAANEKATQNKVNEALDTLIKAIAALKEDLSETVNRDVLKTAISEAKAISGVYTADTWERFQIALSNAEGINADRSVDQTAVNDATKLLNDAKGALQARSLRPVDSTGKDVITITTESELKAAFEKSNGGKYFRLANDIEIKSPYWYGMRLDGVFDGNGHVITLPNVAIFDSIGPDGVVQNLGIQGSAQNYVSGEGSIAREVSGLIINSWSLASVKSESASGKTGGLVSKLKSGGAIVNSYAAGMISAKGATGGLAGEADRNSVLKYSYWLSTMDSKAIGMGDGQLDKTVAKTQKDLYSEDFIRLLNNNREGAMEWNLSSKGYPYHGEFQDYIPESFIEINFTSITGENRTFQSDEGLSISLLEVGEFNKVGTLSHPDGAHWTIDYPDAGGKKPIMVNQETGELFIYE